MIQSLRQTIIATDRPILDSFLYALDHDDSYCDSFFANYLS